MANIPDNVFKKHQHHDVYIDENPINKKTGKPVVGQIASLRCRTCNQWIKWLSGEELIALGRITKEEFTEYKQLRKEQNDIPPRDAQMISLDDLPLVMFK